MNIKTKVHLSKDKEIFIGPGMIGVLKAVEETDSVKGACKVTGISYSKIWNMIKRAENSLGYTLIERTRGGINGGEAHLTNEALNLIEVYNILEKKVQNYAEEEYKKIRESIDKTFK